MVNALQIELLKSRRTKSFIITIFLMFIGFLWNTVSTGSEINSVNYDGASVLFNNQTMNSLFLPIAISIFTSRIVSNELEGQTFKLQESNGRTLIQIFYSKLILSTVFFLILAILGTVATNVFAMVNGVSVPLTITIIQILGQLLSSFSLICIYLTFAMFTDKQGLLLSSGFLGGFIGLILASKSTIFWTFAIPWVGSAYLSPYKFTLINNSNYLYKFDQSIYFRFLIYLIYCLLLYLLVRSIFLKKERQRK
ncbi:putative transporter, trans-membrane domain bacteriocin immunity protein [Streptococcus salivarius CCHSS3]|uniref:Putative transporter n=1 Tax=Streptococcus salivarius TaxID=1304 RepID=D0EMA1_STRSL|nr:ABC transporter permease [Streptococcus salivarius]ACX68647.1 putative transporter [Streptococcus salivarius]MDU2267802.1 ABC transporter permease [Streptococcus salivarius]CCB92974.1 putative transporter, trans-membrane domain bacteriocin immunity protein [Streptococcus salivarius CCHSS3]